MLFFFLIIFYVLCFKRILVQIVSKKTVYLVDGFLFLRVDDGGIDLRDSHITMSQQLRYRIQVRAKFKTNRCERMASRVETYVLVNARTLYPFLERLVESLYGRYVKDERWMPRTACWRNR